MRASDMNDPALAERVLEVGLNTLAALTRGLLDSEGEIITSPPGSNANVHYISEQFAIRDYCWCDFGSGFSDEPANPADSIHNTEDGYCKPNFEHFATGVSASWYKHRGRGFDWINPPTSRAEAIEILLDCMKPLVAGRPSLPRNDLKDSAR